MTTADWLDELPLEPGPPTWTMGTRAVGEDGWLVADEDRERDLALKAQLLTERHDDVFGALDTPEVLATSREVHDLVAGATGVAPDPELHPLDAAGRVVQEDLCLLVLRDGAPHLDAASLCFPSYWRLQDKLGHPLADVHGPVPHYAEDLGSKVDGFLRRLRPDRIVWRRNWSIHDDPAYFLPEATSPQTVDPPDGLWVRSERLTLRRLSSADVVLFTIRTQQAPLAALAEHPGIARRMADVIAGWTDATVAYKGGHGALAAQPWLAARR